MADRATPASRRAPQLSVRIEVEGQPGREFCIDDSTVIGRDASCGIQVEHHLVSRRHLSLTREADGWWVGDQSSSNGTFHDGERVTRRRVDRALTFTLGAAGPAVSLLVEGPPARAGDDDAELADYVEKVRGRHAAPAGRQTLMVRQAFKIAQAHERTRYRWIIGTVAMLLLLAGAYGLYITLQTSNQRALARDMFYSIKALEVEMGRTERSVLEATGAANTEALATSRARRRALEQSYDRFLTEVGFFTRGMAEDEKLIYRVARVFGESELGMPRSFVSEVRAYIEKWRSTNRFRAAVNTALSRGYHRQVAAAMLAEDLPPQFFYLAMQESDFNVYAVGPATRFGYAKGAWQFIPKTATEFGMTLGPQFELGRPDPADDRHDFAKATAAAAKYLKFIYTTDAQASGLLVMASYNWGEQRVIPLVRTLPDNPRERNFWQLLAHHRGQIPLQTYDYVLSIVSAAVIGENPRLFGFDFDNPLAHLDTQSAQSP